MTTTLPAPQDLVLELWYDTRAIFTGNPQRNAFAAIARTKRAPAVVGFMQNPVPFTSTVIFVVLIKVFIVLVDRVVCQMHE